MRIGKDVSREIVVDILEDAEYIDFLETEISLMEKSASRTTCRPRSARSKDS